MKVFKIKWMYQEWYLEWTMMGFGWRYKDCRGWEMDELKVYIGPIRIFFLGDTVEDGGCVDHHNGN